MAEGPNDTSYFADKVVVFQEESMTHLFLVYMHSAEHFQCLQIYYPGFKKLDSYCNHAKLPRIGPDFLCSRLN